MKFTESHEWVEVKDSVATVGITDYAQRELGDVVYVELPKVGKKVAKGQEASVLESTKAASDVYAPITGEIIEVNTTLTNQPELINSSAEKQGWLFKLKIANASELETLLDKDAYTKTIEH